MVLALSLAACPAAAQSSSVDDAERAAERLLGVPAAEALGRPAESVLLCRACSGPSLLIERGRLDHEPAEVQKADGSSLRVRRSARALACVTLLISSRNCSTSPAFSWRSSTASRRRRRIC